MFGGRQYNAVLLKDFDYISQSRASGALAAILVDPNITVHQGYMYKVYRKSLLTFNKFLKITQEIKLIRIFSIKKGVIAVLLARLAITFQRLED